MTVGFLLPEPYRENLAETILLSIFFMAWHSDRPKILNYMTYFYIKKYLKNTFWPPFRFYAPDERIRNENFLKGSV